MLKWQKYIKKHIFLDFLCFCLFLENFWKYIKNMGQKLGSNRCPLFTMLTKQKSSMFCIVSLVKKNLSFCLLNIFFLLTWDPIWRPPLPKPKNVCSSVNLKSHMEIPFNQSYMRSHQATSFNQNKKMCKTWSHCNG